MPNAENDTGADARCPSCLYGFDPAILTDGEPTCQGCGRTARWYAEKNATRILPPGQEDA